MTLGWKDIENQSLWQKTQFFCLFLRLTILKNVKNLTSFKFDLQILFFCESMSVKKLLLATFWRYLHRHEIVRYRKRLFAHFYSVLPPNLNFSNKIKSKKCFWTFTPLRYYPPPSFFSFHPYPIPHIPHLIYFPLPYPPYSFLPNPLSSDVPCSTILTIYWSHTLNLINLCPSLVFE